MGYLLDKEEFNEEDVLIQKVEKYFSSYITLSGGRRKSLEEDLETALN